MTFRRFTLALAVIACALFSAAARAGDSLDALVHEALAANRDLRAERLQLARAQSAVSEATALFLPSVTLNARLSGRGGQVVDFGKLINPAFAALNQLTQSDAFPTDLALVQPAKQETSVRFAMPILDARLYANRALRAGERDARGASAAATARRTVADVRSGWLQAARSQRLVELYDSTLVLVDEAVRVQESLLANGRATPDQVLRARADRADVAQRRADAARLADAARQLLNVRVGRAVDASLEIDPRDADALELRGTVADAVASAASRREELAVVAGGVRAARGAVGLATAGYLPSLVAALDWGVQGERYDFGPDQDFRVASLVLQWTLFNGGQREAQRQGAQALLAEALTRQADAAAQVELDARVAWQAAATARAALLPARDRLAAAKRTWELVAKRHAIGSASLLELLDARTNFTNAALHDLFTTWDYRERCAELERAAAREVLPSIDGGGSR